MAMPIRHICHPEHALFLRELSGDSFVRCSFCNLYFNGPTYCCWDCNIFLHKSCAKLPPKTGHPDHAKHPTLSLTTIFTSTCDKPLCDLHEQKVHIYCCNDCHFSLDLAVAALTLYHLKEEKEKEKIRHFDHYHPLTPFSLDMSTKAECRVCAEKISGSIYGCPDCSFYLHESCARLPREIARHPFHPQHHLTLFHEANYSCDVCCARPQAGWYGHFVYKCNECEFSIDVRCASLEPSENRQEDCGAMERFSHQRRLAPFSVKMQNPRIWCKACDQNISGEVYGCPDSKFFIHRSCPPAQLEESPVAKHQPHEHDLTYFEGDVWSRCSYCGEKCGADSYRCVECDFNVHYDCIRVLPLSIEHNCHFHPLSLHDKYVPYDDEQYCDACEKTRRPDRGVYYCAVCEFAAHIGCVIPWVKKEETRPAELKRLDGEILSLKADVEETERKIVAMQMNVEAQKKKLKELMEKRDDLACGEEEDGPNMEMHKT